MMVSKLLKLIFSSGGPGDIEGTQQSGLGVNLNIANLGKDGEILRIARNMAEDVLDEDPRLEKARK